jgi:hypothetical protein
MILVPGPGHDYLEARLNREYLQEKIPHCIGFEMGGVEIDELADIIGVKDRRVPANKQYFIDHSFTQERRGDEGVIEGLEIFFGKALNYAKKHDVPYALLKEIHINCESKGYSISGWFTFLLDSG